GSFSSIKRPAKCWKSCAARNCANWMKPPSKTISGNACLGVNGLKNRNEKRSGKLKWLLIILIILIVLAGAGSALFIFAVDDGLEGFRATLEELPVISWFLPDAELKLAEQRIHQLEKRLEES